MLDAGITALCCCRDEEGGAAVLVLSTGGAVGTPEGDRAETEELGMLALVLASTTPPLVTESEKDVGETTPDPKTLPPTAPTLLLLLPFAKIMTSLICAR